MPLHLVCYDIAHPRRLRRVARLCARHGQRIQDSVYLVDAPREALERLMLGVARCIDASTDSVRYIPVCAQDLGQSRGLGLCHGLAGPPSHWVI